MRDRERERERDRETDRQTDRHTDGNKIDRQTDNFASVLHLTSIIIKKSLVWKVLSRYKLTGS